MGAGKGPWGAPVTGHLLRAWRTGIDDHRQPVVYMRRDCPVCRSEGFSARARVQLEVGSRRVVQAGATLMLVFGAVTKFGALFTTIPQPIVGGMYCAMFGMIASVGLSNLQLVNLNSPRNLFILGFALFMGLSVPEYFAAQPVDLGADLSWLADLINTLGKTGMAVGAFAALLLDNTIPGTPEERGIQKQTPRG